MNNIDLTKISDDLFNRLVDAFDDFFKLPFGDLMSKYNIKNR